MHPAPTQPAPSQSTARPSLPARTGLVDRVAAWPWWSLPLAIFLMARLVSLVVVLAMGPGEGTEPGWDPIVRWDSLWYEIIATDGYPGELPRDADGVVQQNPWAFFPALPLLAMILGLTGLSFGVSASLVSLAAGGAAMALLFRLLEPVAGRFAALATVTALSFAPSSLTFGVPYTESLALLLVVLALTFVDANRPGAFLVTALLLAVTRPVVLPLAAVAGVVWLHRWWRRHDVVFPMRERLTWAAVGVATVASFAIWPAVTALGTGELTAYALTQQAWHSGDGMWTTWLTAWRFDPAAMVVPVTVLAIYGLAAVRFQRGWPLAVRAWTVLYPLYILGASGMTSSLPRYLMLTAVLFWPFSALLALNFSRGQKVLLLASLATLGVLVQISWIPSSWSNEAGLHP